MGTAPIFQSLEHAYLQSQRLMKWLSKQIHLIEGHSDAAYTSAVDLGAIRGPIDKDKGC